MLEEGKVILINAGTHGPVLRRVPRLAATEHGTDVALDACAAAMQATAGRARRFDDAST